MDNFMKLIFIRHAEPDYEHDSLTEKGFREAELVAERAKNWRVSQFYCSPLGRAQATAAPTLHAHHVSLTTVFPEPAPDVLHKPDPDKAIVYPWLRELHAPVDPELHPDHRFIPWDLTPAYFNEHPLLLDKERWREAELMKHCDLGNQADWIYERLDGLLALHGYRRDGFCYRTDGTHGTSNDFMKYDGTSVACMKEADSEEEVLVFFCHLGVMMMMLSHLINTAPHAMLHGLFVPPASVTVLSAEERIPGQVYFRVQTAGDTSHFRIAGEPVSYYGGFAMPFQE